MTDLAAVMDEHHQNVGFREGPNNGNPWGPEQGVGDHHAYCDSAASMVPHHHGLAWWSDCTFHDKGCSYTPDHVQAALRHYLYAEDHNARGYPAALAIGDLVFFDYNHSGTVDHVETVSALPQGPLGGQYETIGYNTGPRTDGCYRQLRDRTYLHGVLSMEGFYAAAPTPTPAPSPSEEDDMPYIAQLNADLTYQGQIFAKGYAVEVVGQVRHHLDGPQFDARAANGRKVIPMDPNEMTDLFDMTVTDVHRLIKA